MRYPASFLEQLKNVASVSSVVGARLPIKRHGREFQALCPFHKEKSPSFTINDEKGFYHCFGCGAHGDAIGFIKEYEGINYKEAIEKLAGELGLALPQPTREAVVQDKRRRSLQDVCELACRWFESQLAASGGFAARDYLEKRGLNADTIQRFRLGFAPDDRGAMARALMAEGVTQQELLAAGLLIQPDDAGREAYARFRGRIIFPIRDSASKVIAFGGRLLGHHDNAPKYLNSPETELFHKGAMLYNFDLARRAARGEEARLLGKGAGPDPLDLGLGNTSLDQLATARFGYIKTGPALIIVRTNKALIKHTKERFKLLQHFRTDPVVGFRNRRTDGGVNMPGLSAIGLSHRIQRCGCDLLDGAAPP